MVSIVSSSKKSRCIAIVAFCSLSLGFTIKSASRISQATTTLHPGSHTTATHFRNPVQRPPCYIICAHHRRRQTGKQQPTKKRRVFGTNQNRSAKQSHHVGSGESRGGAHDPRSLPHAEAKEYPQGTGRVLELCGQNRRSRLQLVNHSVLVPREADHRDSRVPRHHTQSGRWVLNEPRILMFVCRRHNM